MRNPVPAPCHDNDQDSREMVPAVSRTRQLEGITNPYKVPRRRENTAAAQAIIEAIGPRDEFEHAAATLAAGAHDLAMRMLKNAAENDWQPAFALVYVNAATKLMRAFSEQVAAIERRRQGGSQRIVVEHLTVEPGGRAVVANAISTSGRALPGIEGQPHASDPID